MSRVIDDEVTGGRYECRDQNGDTFFASESWPLSSTRFASWATPANIGAGIWDRAAGAWKLRIDAGLGTDGTR